MKNPTVLTCQKMSRATKGITLWAAAGALITLCAYGAFMLSMQIDRGSHWEVLRWLAMELHLATLIPSAVLVRALGMPSILGERSGLSWQILTIGTVLNSLLLGCIRGIIGRAVVLVRHQKGDNRTR